MASTGEGAFNALLMTSKAVDRMVKHTGSREEIMRRDPPLNSVMAQKVVKVEATVTAVSETGKGSNVNVMA